MGKEIEHKYLVINDSYKKLAVKVYEISQGYLSQDADRVVRIRIKADKGYITIKSRNVGDTRGEFEYEIPVSDAREMLAICLPTVISKTRYIVPFEGNDWEIDEFHGVHEGLTIGEIEIPYSGYEYGIPNFIGENVTGDTRYYNSVLSSASKM